MTYEHEDLEIGPGYPPRPRRPIENLATDLAAVREDHAGTPFHEVVSDKTNRDVTTLRIWAAATTATTVIAGVALLIMGFVGR